MIALFYCALFAHVVENSKMHENTLKGLKFELYGLHDKSIILLFLRARKTVFSSIAINSRYINQEGRAFTALYIKNAQ